MRSNVRKTFLIVLCLGVVSVLAACNRHQERAAPDPDPKPGLITLTQQQAGKIQVQAVAPSQFRRTIETTGTVAFDSDHSTQVLSAISGPVSRLLVSVGARVKPGDPLATIASADFAADISAYRKAEATAANTQRIADLDKQLFANDGISRREMEQAETDALSAQADRDAAMQQLRALGVSTSALEDIRQGRPLTGGQATIRAPIAGTVVERLITAGQLLQAGTTPCFTIANMSTVWVMANIFESDLSFVAAGDPADVYTDASATPFSGKVDYVAALVDPNTRAISTRIVTDNPGGLLKKDMYVRVAIHSNVQKTGLLVPVSAVLRDDEDLPFLFVQTGNNSFARRRVTIGTRSGDMQEITQGIKAGDRIVTEGGLFMQFAQSQ